MKKLTQKQITETIKSMVILAQSQIEECGEPEWAVDTLQELTKFLDGNQSVATTHWCNYYYSTPLEVFSKSELEILSDLGIYY